MPCSSTSPMIEAKAVSASLGEAKNTALRRSTPRYQRSNTSQSAGASAVATTLLKAK